MVIEMVNDLLAASVVFDGAVYVPVMVAIDTFVPLLVAAGMLVAAFCFFLVQLLSLAEAVAEVLGDWLRKRFVRQPETE